MIISHNKRLVGRFDRVCRTLQRASMAGKLQKINQDKNGTLISKILHFIRFYHCIKFGVYD